MRPVTINPQNVADSLNEIQTASHEADIVEMAMPYSVANPPTTGQRDFIGSSVQVSAAGVGNGSDTSEDTLFTFSLTASALSIVGEGLTIEAFGTLAGNADSKSVNLYFGTSKYSTGTSTQSGASWTLKSSVFRTASDAQLIRSEGRIGATPIAVAVTTSAQTDTSAITIKVTGQAGTANANDVVANALIVNGQISDLANTFATWIADRQKGGMNRTT